VGTVVLDASVVLALFDPKDALHTAATAAARNQRNAGATFLLPATVLTEVLVGAARMNAAEMDKARRQAVAAFGAPWPSDERVAVAAALRRARHRTLRLPDALVLATADVAAADMVLTGDQRWRNLDPRVEVIE
jgi:predicted nucleic acid-binding protein